MGSEQKYSKSKSYVNLKSENNRQNPHLLEKEKTDGKNLVHL